jgi:hypothetical protein
LKKKDDVKEIFAKTKCETKKMTLSYFKCVDGLSVFGEEPENSRKPELSGHKA